MVKGIRLRPERRGLAAALFDLEAEIMELVWSRGWHDFTVGDVHRALQTRRELAYTTVMTTVSRLFDKELLGRERRGRAYHYRPRLSRAEFNQVVARDMLQSLPDLGREAALALLVEQVADSDQAELDQLQALIAARRAALGQGG